MRFTYTGLDYLEVGALEGSNSGRGKTIVRDLSLGER